MTYLIQNNIAHFYNREDINNISFPNTIVIHTNKPSILLLNRKDVKRVIDVPFALNNVFVK